MEKGELTSVDRGWLEAPHGGDSDPLPGAAVPPRPPAPPKGLTALLGVESPSSEPSLPPISASAFPSPEALPSAPPQPVGDAEILSVVEPTDTEEVTKTGDGIAPTDTAKRRARLGDLRDDSVPKPPRPQKPNSTPPPSVGARRTLPPPDGYDEIRKTAGRIAYALESSPKPPMTQSSRLRIVTPTPAMTSAMTSAANHHHEQSPSSPSLNVSTSAGYRNDFTATRSGRWTTALAVVLVLIGVGAAAAAGILAMRSPPPEPIAAPAQSVAVPVAANANANAAAGESADGPENAGQATAAEGETAPAASARPASPSQPASAGAIAKRAQPGGPSTAAANSNAPAPPPPVAPAPTAKGAPAPSSSVPPGLQFLKRNL